MLEIGLLIGAVIGFYSAAKNKGLNPILYAVLALVSYLAGAFVFGLILGLLNPTAIYRMSQIELSFLGILAGTCGIVILFIVMNRAAKKKAEQKITLNDEIMDDDSSFEL